MAAEHANPEIQQCPVDHRSYSHQKTAVVTEPEGPPMSCDAQGIWQVRGFAEARSILRDAPTKQAGFRAELIDQMAMQMRPPILYQEGKPHHEQRRLTARFFTPKAVSTNYRRLMEDQTERLIAKLQHDGQADLSLLSMNLAVRVVGEVIGLTNSLRPGLQQRILAFFKEDPPAGQGRLRSFFSNLGRLSSVSAFYLLDVRPAIRARKRTPREDLISHLIAQGRTDSEIMTECITFAAAGMVTTREFLSVAAWHMLEQPDLRARYLAAPEAERHQILHELLRLEPVVAHLYRRATADITVMSQGQPVTIPAGALIDLRVAATNVDRLVVGDDPLAICPARQLSDDSVPPQVMSFGDGHHRCPGAYIAIQESDIFLQRLLAIEELRIVRPPTLGYSAIAAGFVLRDFIISAK